jgi:hypothetical protein
MQGNTLFELLKFFSCRCLDCVVRRSRVGDWRNAPLVSLRLRKGRKEFPQESDPFQVGPGEAIFTEKESVRFGMTRQGVRWRFQRLFNEIYVHAYITICWVESNFGTELREKALAIARERLELQKRRIEAEKACFPKGRNPG